MAVVTRFINTDNSTSGDGTTNETDGSANSAYVSMVAWNTAEATNLVTDGDSHVVECNGATVDSGGDAILSAWTTGASNRLTIRALAGQEHGGAWNTGTYRIVDNKEYAPVIDIGSGCEYITIDGIQVESTGAIANNPRGIRISATGLAADMDAIVIGCIIRTVQTGTPGLACRGVDGRTSGPSFTLVNNIIYGNWQTGLTVDYEDTAVRQLIYNNTIANSVEGMNDQGLTSTATRRVFNNVIDNCTTDFYTIDADVVTGGNCSSDGTSPETGNRNLTFTFLSPTDFHLASGDTGASGKGDDLSSDSDYAFNIDIDLETRSAWDAGADEKAVGGGSGIEILRRRIEE